MLKLFGSLANIQARCNSNNFLRGVVIFSNTRWCTTMASPHVKHVYKDIVKSDEDKRLYRGLELSNGIKVMLVSDPETDKSAAAMDVHIGHMSDPVEIPGLAHFCEHMLFLGTEKFPEENEYNKYLSEHSGSSNAFTSPEHTNFYFDVAPDHLRGALDRFSQFFLSPLFTASATEREVNAVNSENDKNLPSDSWRLHQLEKATSNPNHPYHKFGTGNKTTLLERPKEMGLDPRDELLKYHEKFYSSNVMGLSIVGKESLDELTDLAVDMFAEVKNKNVTIPEWLDPPFGTEQLQTKLYAVPVKDIRSLAITWPTPDLQPYYKTNPGHYLGHLLGHEGSGSLLSELKARGWVNTLVGGQKAGAKGFMFFIVNVDLTEEGIEHVDDIVTLVFQYINMLKKNGPQEWVFDECKDLSAMQFRFKGKELPREYACHLAGILHEFPTPNLLSAPYLLEEFRPDLINMVLDCLTPENIRVGIVGKRFEGQTDQKEKWYGTDYKQEKIPPETIEKWKNAGFHENLKLPEKNEFIPTDFDIVPREPDAAALPHILMNTPLSRVWFKQDDNYLLPKAFLTFEIRCPKAHMDPLHVNMTHMFAALFKDALNEYAYAAELAGLGYSLSNTMYGIQLKVSGYSHKQHVLLKKVMGKLTSFEIDPKRFEIFKELYVRGLKNFHAEQPHQHAIYYTNLLMCEQAWTTEELLDAVEDMTVEKVQAFIPEFLSRIFMEGFIYGNVTQKKAHELVDIIQTTLTEQAKTKPLLPSQLKRYREVQLPDGDSFVYKQTNSVHKSSAVEIYYQCNMQETNNNMRLELFCQIIQEPCFNILRTKEQLGYIVFSGARRNCGVQGLRIIVQSDRTPEYVEKRVEAFLHKMESYIEEMSDEVFVKHVDALATRRLEKPKKMGGQNTRFWSEIISQQYNFDRASVEVAFLRTIKKDELLQWYKELICCNAPKRHKIAVHVQSTIKGETAPEAGSGDIVPESAPLLETEAVDGTPELPVPNTIEDVVEFKRNLALYPLAKPFITVESSTKSKL